MKIITKKKLSAEKFILLLCLFSVSIFVVGCKSEPAEDSASHDSDNHEIHVKKTDSKSQDSDEKAEENSGGGDCSNPYYPIETDTEREYKVGGTAPGTYVLKQKMRESNGFTETRKFADDLEVLSNWSCSKEGLRNADYNNAISKSNVNVGMETLESKGVTIPKVWEKGKKWKAEYKIRAKLMGQTADGNVTVDNEIVSMDENVSVQAGDYVAARIDSVITINMAMKGTKVPGTKLTMSNWYAPKVGLIKQETKIGASSSSVELTGEK